MNQYLERLLYSCCHVMSVNPIDDKSKLVQVMSWCRQATRYYLSQCWPRSRTLYTLTRPQWTNKMAKLHRNVGGSSNIWYKYNLSLAVHLSTTTTSSNHHLSTLTVTLPMVKIVNHYIENIFNNCLHQESYTSVITCNCSWSRVWNQFKHACRNENFWWFCTFT